MKNWVLYIGMTLVFGCGFLFLNIASQEIEPFELIAVRMTITTLVLYLYMRMVHDEFHLSWGIAFLGIFNYALPLSLMVWAQRQGVNSGMTSVLVATNPIFTLMIAHYAFDDERINRYKFIGVIAGFLGTIILASRNFDGGLTSGLIGQLAIILAALLFAITGVYSRKVMKDNQVSPVALTTGTTFVAMIVCWGFVIAGALMGNPITDPTTVSGKAIFALFILTFFHSILGFAVSNYIIRELGAGMFSTMTYITPVIALILGAIFLNEIIDSAVILGTLVILGGIAITNIDILRRVYVRSLLPLR